MLLYKHFYKYGYVKEKNCCSRHAIIEIKRTLKMTITSNLIAIEIIIILNLQEVHEHQPSLEVQVIQHLLSGLAHQPLP